MRFLSRASLTAFTALLVACGGESSNQVLDPASIQFTIAAECQGQIVQLRNATSEASFSLAKDQAGLLGKLDNAARALSAGKNADAAQKLTDFLTKVTTLQAQGKLDSDDAAALIAGAQSAIACVNDL